MSKKSMWKKPTTYAVLAVLGFLLFSISKEARAETVLEVAPIVAVSGDPQKSWGALMLHERFKDKYSVGVILQIAPDRAQSNRGVEVLRYSKYKGAEVGLGVTWWARESAAWNAKHTFSLMIGHEVSNNCHLRLRHWSTGGTSSRNAGLDMLTFGCSFGR